MKESRSSGNRSRRPRFIDPDDASKLALVIIGARAGVVSKARIDKLKFKDAFARDVARSLVDGEKRKGARIPAAAKKAADDFRPLLSPSRAHRKRPANRPRVVR